MNTQYYNPSPQVFNILLMYLYCNGSVEYVKLLTNHTLKFLFEVHSLTHCFNLSTTS